MGDKDLINELFEITKNLDSIAIIDFISLERVQKNKSKKWKNLQINKLKPLARIWKH